MLDLCCGTGPFAGVLIAATGSSVSTHLTRGWRSPASASDSAWSATDDPPRLTLDGVFEAAVYTFDGLHYLTPDEFRLTVAAVAQRLRPAGWLTFDLHTDPIMDFTISNPVVAGESAGSGFAISSVVDAAARTCDTIIALARFHSGRSGRGVHAPAA